MENKDWEIVREKLSIPYGACDLVCDNYLISCRIRPIGYLKYGIMIFVNGKFKGVWLSDKDNAEAAEIRQRFFRPKKVFLHSKKIRDDLKFRKCAKSHGMDIEKFIIIYNPIWKNVNSMIKHFKANNQKIQLKEDLI